ncbi:putative P450 monooxygenase [Aspergillus heterothallicus]
MEFVSDLPSSIYTSLVRFLSLIGCFLVHCLWHIIYYRYFHELRHFPGPFWASVTRLWYTWHFFNGTQTEAEWKAVQKYGPVIRVSPTMLLLAEADALPAVYHRRDIKGRYYLPGVFKTPNGIVMRHPGEQSAHRRLVAAPYSMSNAAYLFSDTIADLTVRKPLGQVAAGGDAAGMLRQIRLGTFAFVILGSLYPLVEGIMSSPLGKYIAMRPEQKFGFGAVMSKADGILRERKEALRKGEITKAERGDGEYDFLQAFLDVRTPEGAYLDPDKIQTEIFVILGAGFEAFQSTVSAVLVEVLSRPEILAKLEAELQSAVNTGKLTQPVPTCTEVATHLPYFVACLREAMRLNPALAFTLPREHTADDPELILNGRVIQPGTELACIPWISHRDRAVYGDDAEEYRPERWMGDDSARVRAFEKYNLAWGYGSRVCLGKHMATMMLYKVPVALFLAFEMALCKASPGVPKPTVKPRGAALVWRDVWFDLRPRKGWAAEVVPDVLVAEETTLEEI